MMMPETRHDVTVDRCEQCGSLWFDAQELDQWLSAAYPADALSRESRIPRRGLGGHRCPRCPEWLESAGWTGLVLDRCRGCRGLFVEAREIVRMQEEELPHEVESLEARLHSAIGSAGWTLLGAKEIVSLILRFLY